MTDYRPEIMNALKAFAANPLAQAAADLFAALGYRSDKTFNLAPNTADNFAATFGRDNLPDPDKALLADWLSVDLLFQLTADELAEQLSVFNTNRVDNTIIESYLFFAIHLREESYTRTQLATITRQVNRLFPMPALILFRHGDSLTLSIINRRLHKRDAAKDVLEKVTLIKEIRFANPHRAHLEILHDLSLPQLQRQRAIANFVELHNAWQKALDSSELNKRFFKEIADWYFWAVQTVQFPADAHPDEAARNAVNVIRLITRLIFVWFIKEKGLVPDAVFNLNAVQSLLKDTGPGTGTYYRAILQNLFFATLNQEMGKRKFRNRTKKPGGRDQNYMAHTLYRYEDYFIDPAEILTLFANIPFLNGGLFECLDKEDPVTRIDGFSDRADNPVHVPNFLFFGDERAVDLNKTYGTRGKSYKTRGLINIFNRYKFTITENTPIEEEIALDPELLGKVFENLLAAYNPETEITARKQTGSFYTPREIVNYMVDESLLAYLETQLHNSQLAIDHSQLESRLRRLFAYTDDAPDFSEAETAALINAINSAKTLDPAVGSGAFPMGVLHKLVFILSKLDPDNARWKAVQRKKALRETEQAFLLGDKTEREERLLEINEVFEQNASDYGRKLYLIENCIYGVDIQPIAVQIAKLRFFISLVVDQRLDEGQPNRGVRPLPNLETKFVAANTLLGIEKPPQISMGGFLIQDLEKELAETRHKHFNALTPKTKRKYRAEDERLRREIGKLLKENGYPDDTVQKLANWNPYDPNTSAGFFDPEWMFGVADGFDVVIGNPPYVGEKGNKEIFRTIKNGTMRGFYKRKIDLFYLFFHIALDFIKSGCPIIFITTNYYLTASQGGILRKDIKQRAIIEKVVNFNELRIFESASGQHNMITLLRKGQNPEFRTKTCISKRTGDANSEILSWILGWSDQETDYYDIKQKSLFDGVDNYIRLIGVGDSSSTKTNSVPNILEKIKSQGVMLGQICNVNQGIISGADKITNRHIKKGLIPEKSRSYGVYVLSRLELKNLKLYDSTFA